MIPAASLPSIRGKKLLILGAGPYQLPVIQKALELGCTVITADYLESNPGHRLSDFSEIVSTTDPAAMLAAAKRHKIDGVMTYGSDVSAPAAAFVSEQLGLPGNPSDVVRKLQSKQNFRKLQRDLDLPHPPFASGDSADAICRDAEVRKLTWPLLVKPADASGSKGQSLAHDLDQLREAFSFAAGMSRSGTVIAEARLMPHMMELVGEVLVNDGRVRFSAYGHNYFSNDRWPRVPSGEIMPGFFGEKYRVELDRQVQKIVSAAELRTGCINLDAVIAADDVHILDIGFRNGGNLLADLVQLTTGMDITAAAIYAALGISYPLPDARPEQQKWVVSHVVHSDRDGILESIEIEPSLEARLTTKLLFKQPGEPVRSYTRGDYGLGLLIVVTDAPDEARDLAGTFHHRYEVHLRTSNC